MHPGVESLIIAGILFGLWLSGMLGCYIYDEIKRKKK